MSFEKTYKFEISGAVQGVGFRPYIYKLATAFGIKGEVYNDAQGVKIILNTADPAKFSQAILNALPPLSRVDEIKVTQIEKREFENFSIVESKIGQKTAPILPDFAICDECKAEFYDKNNRRYHYPFINCTNCGPRFSIIKKLPYDRQNTTMDKFKMCDECRAEYEEPLNRRFHAEPISCASCGPKLFLKDRDGTVLKEGSEAVGEVAKMLKEGKVVAIKGIGGFHLVCDATNSAVIKRVRESKNRPFKPFAIMCKDLFMAEKIAVIDKDEKELLDSKIKPIVILKVKKSALPSNLAPNLDKIAIFLPPTALHLLLFEMIDFPIIATSANISGEPIIYNQEELLKKLKNSIDFILDNDREIINPSDDSLAFVVGGKAHFLRTSRGIRPKIVKSDFDIKGTFLALGAELKNEFCIYKDGLLFLSPYIGDLKTAETKRRFYSILELFKKRYELKFDLILADKHPGFWLSKEFLKRGYRIEKIQHHYAHLISNLYENLLLGSGKKFLGFCFDGTGYGDDGAIWGGEVFVFDEFSYERVLKFDEFFLVGGDETIKNPALIAYLLLKSLGVDDEELKSRLDPFLQKNIDKVYKKRGVKTSSVGRIFDAFGAFALGFYDSSYDGQIGMQIESLYDESIKSSYKFSIEDDKIVYKNAFLKSSEPKEVKASKFINSFVEIIVQIAKTKGLDVILSGGVFQNQTLMKLLSKEFKKENIVYYTNEEIPTNDSGIALGQMIHKLSLLKRAKFGQI